MISTLDVVPVHPDRAVVMRLLMATPGPVKPGLTTRLLPECQYRFTLEDIDTLVSAKRADLTELVLMSTTDIDLLDEVSRTRTSSALARGVCRNRRTPVSALLRYFGDSRKGVTSYARSGLAALLSCRVPEVDGLIPAVQEVLSCSDEELLDVLGRYSRNLPSSVQFSLTLLSRSRQTPLSEVLGDSLVENAVRLGSAQGNTALTSFAAINAVSTKFLLKLAASGGLFGSRAKLLLVERLDRMSQPQRHHVYQMLKTLDPMTTYHFGCRVPAGPYADEMYHFDPALHALVADCPHLSAQVASQWAERLVKFARVSPSGSAPNEFAVLSHPGVKSDLLHAALAGTNTRYPLATRFPVAMKYVASNPNLTLGLQRLLFQLEGPSLSSAALRTLVASGHVDSTFVAELLDTLLDAGQQSSSIHASPSRGWAGHSVRLAREILDNPQVPESVVRTIPAGALLGPSWGPVASGANGLVRLADSVLGSDPSAWTELLTLLPEWDGTVGDLATVVATV